MAEDMMLSIKGFTTDEDGNRVLLARAEPLTLKTADPVFSHTQPLTPPTFDMQYPQPLDPLEVMELCEEISAVRNIPVMPIDLKVELWMETTNLYYDAGQYAFFADGECPEEYTQTGTYHTTVLKNYGVKKSLTLSDIKHSGAIAAPRGGGIGALLGGLPSGEREPGGYNTATFQREAVADIKEKEIRKGMTLVLNALDWTLIRGAVATDPLEFDGLETLITNCTGEHTNTSCPTGTFSADDFDRFISESCAKPTHVWGHPLALQMVAAQYFQLGWQGSQQVAFVPPATGYERITPGYGFANAINTQVGRLPLIGDANFNRTAVAGDCGGLFRSIIYPLRMIHNGEPLIYRPQQFPLSYQDLTPGCTAVSFEIWGKEALTVKMCCAQGRYTANFNGNIASTCTRIGSLGPGRTGGAPVLT